MSSSVTKRSRRLTRVPLVRMHFIDKINVVKLTKFWLTLAHDRNFRYIRRSFSRFWGVFMRNRSGAIHARARWYVCKKCGRHRLAGSIGDSHGCAEAQEKRSKVDKQRKFTSEVINERNDGKSLFRKAVTTTTQRAADKKG